MYSPSNATFIMILYYSQYRDAQFVSETSLSHSLGPERDDGVKSHS